MSRLLARKAAPGYNMLRNFIIEQAQTGLKAAGFLEGSVDGWFGNGTQSALKACQTAKGLPVTGELDAATWTAVLPDDPLPDDFEICLGLTQSFEGHGFGKAAGNFDGAGVTWGIIGFNLKFQTLNAVVNDAEAAAPGTLNATFGTLADTFRAKLALPPKQAIAWGDSISLPNNKSKLEPAWEKAFAALGETKAAQTAQLDHARQTYWTQATSDAHTVGLAGLPGLSLCFDTAVQNGRIDEIAEIEARFNAEPNASPMRRRVIVAEEVAKGASAKWHDAVLRRKMCIATGNGTVNGARYNTSDWGISD